MILIKDWFFSELIFLANLDSRIAACTLWQLLCRILKLEIIKQLLFLWIYFCDGVVYEVHCIVSDPGRRRSREYHRNIYWLRRDLCSMSSPSFFATGCIRSWRPLCFWTLFLQSDACYLKLGVGLPLWEPTTTPEEFILRRQEPNRDFGFRVA